MTANETTLRCPSAETIAALAEGRLDAARLDDVLAHVETCTDCMNALDTANAALHLDGTTEHRATRRVWWLAAAAAVAIVSLVVTRPWSTRGEVALADLVALAPRSARIVEPRLSGGFAWAEYRGPMRASGAVTDEERLRLGGAAADAIQHANRDASPDAQHVAGVAILLADDPLKAIDRLRMAGQRAPDDARIASDLAAARYTAALALDRPSLYPEALDDADRALHLDPNLAEALFNRALILERLGLPQEARRAWERCLAVEPSSPWAEEARRRLTKLPSARNETSNPQQARAYAEVEQLGRWAEATLRGDETEATRFLTMARTTGDALASSTGESLLRDAVAAIDAHRAVLSRAHQLYRHGRMSYARQRLDDAERDLRTAATLFAEGGSPMEDVARYFAASVQFDRGDVRSARESLEDLVRRADAHPRYFALRAQTRWELALCRMYDNDWQPARTLLIDAESLFARLGERANLAFVRALLATTLVSLGRPDEAWAARIRAFELLSAEPRDVRLLVALGGAARMEQRAGRRNAARALLRVNVEEARAAGNAYYLADALVRSALLAEPDDARRLVIEVRALSAKIDDPSLRDRARADADFAEGVTLAYDDPRKAVESLTAAIRYFEANERLAFLPELLLHRARAALRIGNTKDALADLDRGIAEIERRPQRLAGEITASAVIDADASLREEAIRLSLARNDAHRAFAYAERAHSLQPPPIETLQRLLHDTSTIVLHVTALPHEVVSFAISADDFLMARSPFERILIASASPEELYGILIQPSARLLAGAEHVIVVADRYLDPLPFAAMRDAKGGTYLVERVSVSMAPSAAALELAPIATPRAVIAVALPSGEHAETLALPASGREVADIAPLYAGSEVLAAGDATYRAVRDAARRGDAVLHLAGHTERQSNDDTALRFADGERVTWTTIAATPLERKTVVVLAACETLSRSSSPHVRSLSLGAAFVAAGAGNVIGTLAPIADSDAKELFLSIHRQLANGASPAVAVRRTQLDALASGRLQAWKSIAVLTRCINAPKRAKGGRSWATS